MEPVVDIVIPVHRNLAVTRQALASVLAARNHTPYELVVVDDATPEAALARWLDELAAAGVITLLRNPTNRGLVASANRGIRLHPTRDVVLLDSDAEVHGDWLDRLRAAACSGPRVASATPFTNSGWIASYPTFPLPGPLPAGASAAELDRLCREVNAGVRVPTPIGVGFCMYLRRACLDEVGAFDETRPARGRTEESELCLRAARRGWTHVLAADVFVHHIGGASAEPDERHARSERASAILRTLHPELRSTMRAHTRQDPARPHRLALDLARLAASLRPRLVIAVDHDDPLPPGDEDHETLVLRVAKDRAELVWARPGERFRAFFMVARTRALGEEALLAEVLAAVGARRVEARVARLEPLVTRLRARLAHAPSAPLPPHSALRVVAWPDRPGGAVPIARRLDTLRHRALDLLDGRLHAIARRAPQPLRAAVRRWLTRDEDR